MSSTQLWEHFCVVGLSQTLVTVQGEQGWFGSEQKYKPHLIDSLLHNGSSRVPPELPTCCLPAGVDILSADAAGNTELLPQAFAVVLTEGDGTKIYASCLAFHDSMPGEICCKFEELLGAKALKAIILLSHQPYLQSAAQVLRELYCLAFWHGSKTPLPELINSLLAIPAPQLGARKVWLRLGHLQRPICPPMVHGPPPGELSLMPLLEVLRPDNLVALFAAVLLEQRVLVRSNQMWMLTVAAEGVTRLLYPLTYQHVYVPVMPYSLTEYLEVPTPFLMGLHSSEDVDPRLLDSLVVVDLDRDIVSLGKDDVLMQRCLNHPYMKQLTHRIRTLLRPATTDVDALSEPQDHWVKAARQLSQQPASPLQKQALILRIFQEFFRQVLDGYQLYLHKSPASESTGVTDTLSRDLSRGLSSIQEQLRRMSSSAAGASGATAGLSIGRSVRRSISSAGGQQPSALNMEALLQHHQAVSGQSDPALLQQIMQGLLFLSFLDQQSSNTSVAHPMSWLTTGKEALQAWREAEELLVVADAHQCRDEDIISIPQQIYWPLMPAGGLLYQHFPYLITSERDGTSGSKLIRRYSGAHKRRPAGAGGKRRAISELMGQEIDLWGKGPGASLNSNTALPPMLSTAGTLPKVSSTGSGLNLGGALPNHGQLTHGSMTLGSPRTSNLSVQYSAEADLVLGQTAMLVQLMQMTAVAGQGSNSTWSADDLQAARLLLCVQTGGNGWFLVSKLRELIFGGSSSHGGAADAAGSIASRQIGSVSAVPGLGRHVSVSDTGFGSPSKPRPEVVYHNSRSEANLASLTDRSKSSSHKSPKSGSTSRSTSPVHTKLVERVDSIASVMASAFSAAVMNRSVTPSRQRSPRHSADSVTRPVPKFKWQTSSSQAPAAASDIQAAPQLQQLPPAEHVVVTDITGTVSNSASTAAGASGSGERAVSVEAFEVLADMMNSLIEVAAVQDDHRVTLAALEVSCAITYEQAGSVCRQRHVGATSQLLYKLARNPVLHTDWFWAGCFSFAVSSSCLQGPELVDIKQAVLQAMTDCARYMSGVGIAGYPAWLLLTSLAAEHLTNTGSLDPQSLLNLRRQLAAHELAAKRQLQALPADSQRPLQESRNATADPCVKQTNELPEHLISELLVCGITVGVPAAPSKHASPQLVTGAAELPGRATEAAQSESINTSAAAADKGAVSTSTVHVGDQQASTSEAADSNKRTPGAHSQHSAGIAQVSAVRTEPASGSHAVLKPMVECGLTRANDAAVQAAVAKQQLRVGPHTTVGIATSSPLRTPSPPAPQKEPSKMTGNLKAAALQCIEASSSSLGTSSSSTTVPETPGSPRGTSGQRTPDQTATLSNTLTKSMIYSRATKGSPKSARQRQYAEMYARPGSKHCRAASPATAADAPAASTDTAASNEATPDSQLQVHVEEQGGPLHQPGAYHCAAMHSSGVLALDACNHTVVSVGSEGTLNVTDTRSGHMRIMSTVDIPALQPGNISSGSSGVITSKPVVKLWPDGRRVAVGNAKPGAVWILDLQKAGHVTELAGCSSGVSAILVLQRNRDSLLTGLSSCSTSYSSSNADNSAAVYLWDIRRPQRPAASLDVAGYSLPLHSQPVSAECYHTAADASDGFQLPIDTPIRTLPATVDIQQAVSASQRGVTCLAVHDDGVLAAAGCQDGTTLVWDMRKPAVTLATCLAHQGPVQHVTFAPTCIATPTAQSGPLLITTSDDWTVGLWDASNGSSKATCIGHAAAVTALQLVQGSSATRLVTGAADGSVGVWGVGGEVYSLSQPHAAPVQLLAATSDAIITGAQDGSSAVCGVSEVLACSIHKPMHLTTLQQHSPMATCMAYDATAQLVCSGGPDGAVSLWTSSR